MKDKFSYFKEKEVKNKLLCHKIDIPIYKCAVKIIFDKQAKQLEKEWRGTISGFGGLTRDFLKESGIVLISFPNKKPKTEDVVHEFYHAVDLIMSYIGHNNSSSSDEPSAYLMGYLIKEFKKIKP